MTLLLKFQRAERCALFLGLAALVLLAGGWPGKAAAQQDLFRPAAVVNDDIISVLDVAMRLQLAIVAAGVEDSPDVRRRLTPQIRTSLIDERLQMPEAVRLDTEVTDVPVPSAIEPHPPQTHHTE